MSRQPQAPDSEPRPPRPYGRPQRSGGSLVVMVSLRSDAAAAVLALVKRHGLSRSGAVHHLVRLGAGLDPLPPLN